MKLINDVEVFRAGYYTKHNRRYEKADLAKMIDGVTKLPLGLEFTTSVLDGNLGEVVNLRVNDDKISADVSMPDWAFYLVKDELNLAISHDRETMKLIGISIVKEKAMPEPIRISEPPFLEDVVPKE